MHISANGFCTLISQRISVVQACNPRGSRWCNNKHGVTARNSGRTLAIAFQVDTRLKRNSCQRAQQTNPCHPTGPSLLSAPMHPAVSRVAENVAKHNLLLAPLLFTVLGAIASVNSPVQHSLLVTSASWAIIWIPLVFRVGLYSNSTGRKKNTSWLAGAFLALAHICDRAACDKDGIRATKVAGPTACD